MHIAYHSDSSPAELLLIIIIIAIHFVYINSLQVIAIIKTQCNVSGWNGWAFKPLQSKWDDLIIILWESVTDIPFLSLSNQLKIKRWANCAQQKIAQNETRLYPSESIGD